MKFRCLLYKYSEETIAYHNPTLHIWQRPLIRGPKYLKCCLPGSLVRAVYTRYIRSTWV